MAVLFYIGAIIPDKPSPGRFIAKAFLAYETFPGNSILALV